MVFICAVAAAWLTVEQGRYYLRPAEEWSRFKYGSQMIDARTLGKTLGKTLTEGETLFQLGDHPDLYYYSGHGNTTPLLWSSHLQTSWPIAPWLYREVTERMDRDGLPDICVGPDLTGESLKPRVQQGPSGLFGRLLGPKPKSSDKLILIRQLYEWLKPHYVKVDPTALLGPTPGVESIYVRRGSELERRLTRGRSMPVPREQPTQEFVPASFRAVHD